jgi:hypothetical protein
MTHDRERAGSGSESSSSSAAPGGAPGKSSRTSSLVQRKAAEGNASGGGGDDPFSMHLGNGAPLDAGTRRQMEGSFGQSFADVRVHADSPQASGSTLAHTQGTDVHFAPGQYQPGTGSGNWLIAHELAHVVQQSGGSPAAQSFDRSEAGIGHEADADQAADAAVAGQRAVVHMSTRAGVRQSYEAWEHRAMGDSNGGAGRTVTVNCGITLTYGQVVALSGDFYRSPEALMNAPRTELEAILRTMDRERRQAGATDRNPFGTGAPTQAEINQNNADYEMATTGPGSRAEHHDHRGENPFMDDDHHEGGPDHDHPHGTVTEGGHVEDNGPQGGAAPNAEAAFLGLADNNASHFSPENIRLNFIPKHQLAIDLAKEAWQARHPGATPGAPSSGGPATPAAGGGPAPAPGHSGPAPAGSGAAAPAAGANPGTPAARPAGGGPAAPVPTGAATPDGHTVSTQPGSSDAGERKEAMAILSDGFAVHFLTDAFASGHLVSGSVGRNIGASYYSRHSGRIALALTSCLVRDYPAAAVALGAGGVAAVIGGASALISSKAGSLTLKLVHDYFNQHGVTVKNPLGTEWTTVGDANLASSPTTQQQGSLAATASREGVDKAVREGVLSDEDRDKPMKYVPDQAKFASGPYQSIDAFCSDETIFDAVLSETMLSADPASNKLWQLIKGNVGPMIALKLRQAGRWAGDLATGAYETVRDGAVAAGTAIRDGAVRAGTAIRDGAVAAGGAIRDGAVAAGGAIADGARAVGRGAERVGGAIADTASEGAAWVRSWFD